MTRPVSTLFLSVMLLDAPITRIQLAGTALVLRGIYLLSLKNMRGSDRKSYGWLNYEKKTAERRHLSAFRGSFQ